MGPIYHTATSLLQILFHTNSEGMIQWDYRKAYLEREGILDMSEGIEKQKKVGSAMFGLSPLYLSHSERYTNKAYLKRLNPRILSLNEEFAQVSANTCAYFGLPGVSPATEIQEMVNFFGIVRQIYMEYYTQNPAFKKVLCVDIFNSGRPPVHESLDFIFIINENEEGYEYFKNQEKILHARVHASPVLMSFFRQCRRRLNCVGPHSWLRFAPEDMFEPEENPVTRNQKCGVLPEKETPVV